MMATKTVYYNLLDLSSRDLGVIIDGLTKLKESTTNVENLASIEELLEQIRGTLNSY